MYASHTNSGSSDFTIVSNAYLPVHKYLMFPLLSLAKPKHAGRGSILIVLLGNTEIPFDHDLLSQDSYIDHENMSEGFPILTFPAPFPAKKVMGGASRGFGLKRGSVYDSTRPLM